MNGDRPSGWFWALAAREGRAGELDLNHEPFADGAIRIKGVPPLAVSPGAHAVIRGENMIIGDAELRRDGSDVFAIGQIWEDMDLGREVAKMLRHRGEHMGVSLGFQTVKSGPPTEEQRKLGIKRVLVDVVPREISPVLLPAQPWARMLEIKSSRQEVEDRLGLLIEKRRLELEALNRHMDLTSAKIRKLLRGRYAA